MRGLWRSVVSGADAVAGIHSVAFNPNASSSHSVSFTPPNVIPPTANRATNNTNMPMPHIRGDNRPCSIHGQSSHHTMPATIIHTAASSSEAGKPARMFHTSASQIPAIAPPKIHQAPSAGRAIGSTLRGTTADCGSDCPSAAGAPRPPRHKRTPNPASTAKNRTSAGRPALAAISSAKLCGSRTSSVALGSLYCV